ncbi:hypothetical protein ACNKHL_22315 [Shigella flexneri]
MRHQLLDEQKMTSDGITADSLLTIYRELHHRFEVLRKPRISVATQPLGDNSGK